MVTEIKANTRLMGSESIKSVLDIAEQIYEGAQVISWDCNDDLELDVAYLETFESAIEWIKLAIKMDDEMEIRQHNIEAAYLSKASEDGVYHGIEGLLEYNKQNYLHWMIEWYNELAARYNKSQFESPWTEEDAEDCANGWYDQVDEHCKQYLAERKGGSYIPLEIRKILNAKAEVTAVTDLRNISDWSHISTTAEWKYTKTNHYEIDGEVFDPITGFMVSMFVSDGSNRYIENQFSVVSEDTFTIKAEDPETETIKQATFKVDEISISRAVVEDIVVESGYIRAKEC